MAKLKLNKLESSFDKACAQARNAFRLGKFPERPVLLLGRKGFYLGSEKDENGIAVCTCLDEFEVDAPENIKPEDLPLPAFGDVSDFLYGHVEASVGKRDCRRTWNEAMELVETEGKFSALINPVKPKPTKRKTRAAK